MKVKEIKNIEASVRQRLLNISRERNEDFNLILIRYASERLLCRLSVSDKADQFILKGAMLFSVWADAPQRPTRDVDFLAQEEFDMVRFLDFFKSLCKASVQNDGLRFDPSSFRIHEIIEPDEYGGVRIRMRAHLGKIKIPVQVDVGFGDVVTPKEQTIEYPTLLDFPPPRLKAYPPESVMSEKFQTLVDKDMANSRMKDFYDMYIISRLYKFKKGILVEAIQATFKRRNTEIPKELPIGLSDEFASDKSKTVQWKAFIEKNDIQDAPIEFQKVIEYLREFFKQYLSIK